MGKAVSSSRRAWCGTDPARGTCAELGVPRSVRIEAELPVHLRALAGVDARVAEHALRQHVEVHPGPELRVARVVAIERPFAVLVAQDLVLALRIVLAGESLHAAGALRDLLRAVRA